MTQVLPSSRAGIEPDTRRRAGDSLSHAHSSPRDFCFGFEIVLIGEIATSWYISVHETVLSASSAGREECK